MKKSFQLQVIVLMVMLLNMASCKTQKINTGESGLPPQKQSYPLITTVIQLGFTKEDVLRLLGEPELRYDSYFYYGNFEERLIYFSKDGFVTNIELDIEGDHIIEEVYKTLGSPTYILNGTLLDSQESIDVTRVPRLPYKIYVYEFEKTGIAYYALCSNENREGECYLKNHKDEQIVTAYLFSITEGLVIEGIKVKDSIRVDNLSLEND